MKHTSIKITFILCALLLVASCKKKDQEIDPDIDLKAQNRLSLGVSAEDILSSDNYPSITVEFVYFGLYLAC